MDIIVSFDIIQRLNLPHWEGILKAKLIRFFSIPAVKMQDGQSNFVLMFVLIICKSESAHTMLHKNKSLNTTMGTHSKKTLRQTISSLLTALFLLALSILPTSAYAAGVSAQANYVVSVAGTIVANMDVTLQDNGSIYSLDLNASVAGLGNFVARGSAGIDVTGRSGNHGYAGRDFKLQTSSNAGDVEVSVNFSNNANVSAFVVTPPLRPRTDQVPVERAHLRGVNDMLSAFIIKNARFDRSLCERNLEIFTGIERFSIAMKYASSENATSARTGYQGPVILCQLNYKPISGHYTRSQITAYLERSERMLIWYAPVGNSGTYIPYRVLIGTSLGDLSVVLTSLK